jgi:hypothetical protein
VKFAAPEDDPLGSKHVMLHMLINNCCVDGGIYVLERTVELMSFQMNDPGTNLFVSLVYLIVNINSIGIDLKGF